MSTSIEKKWMIAPKKHITTEEDLIMGKLACGCTCETCLKSYKELIENREYVKQLKKALHNEKIAMTDTISIIEEEEKKHNTIVFDLKTEIKDLKSKVSDLEHIMDVESKHRLGEKYKKEELLQQDEMSRQEMDTMRKAIVQMQADLEAVLQDNENVAYKLQYEEQKNKILLNKMQQYEQQISECESMNSDLRIKLTQQFDHQISGNMGSFGSNRLPKKLNMGSNSSGIGVSSSSSNCSLFASRIPTSSISNILAQQSQDDLSNNSFIRANNLLVRGGNGNGSTHGNNANNFQTFVKSQQRKHY